MKVIGEKHQRFRRSASSPFGIQARSELIEPGARCAPHRQRPQRESRFLVLAFSR